MEGNFQDVMRILFEKVLVQANADFLAMQNSYNFEPVGVVGEHETDGGNLFRVTLDFEPRERSAAQLRASRN